MSSIFIKFPAMNDDHLHKSNDLFEMKWTKKFLIELMLRSYAHLVAWHLSPLELASREILEIHSSFLSTLSFPKFFHIFEVTEHCSVNSMFSWPSKSGDY